MKDEKKTNSELMEELKELRSQLADFKRDEAEQKRAEEALKESEERFRAVFETAEDYIFIKDRSLRYTQLNPAMEQLFKRPTSELIGQTDAELFGEDAGAHIREVDSRVLGGEIIEEEYTKPVNGGERRTFHVIKVPMRGASGEIIGLCGIARDITDRKRVEEALKESEANLVEAQRMAHIGNWQRNMKTNVISWSDEMFNIFKIKKQEPNWKHLFELVHPDDIDGFVKALTAMYQEKKPLDIEFRIVHPDGSLAYVQNRGEIVCDESGTPIKTIGTLQDITERKQVEEALRESEAKYRSFINNAIDVIFTLDVDGNYVEVNESFLRELGYDREEIIGANFIKATHPEDHPITLSSFEEAKRGARNQFEYRSKKKDGSIQWYSSKGRPIYDSKGSVVFLEVISRNITELKKTQQQLLDSQKMEAIGTLAGGIAHDFNNLMTTVLGYASFLKEKAKVGDPFHKGLLAIEKSATKAAELTSQLLAYSQKGKYQIVPININNIVKNVDEIILRSFDKSIKTDINTADKLKNIEGDPSQITQVVMNLTINAKEAMPDGGTLTIQTYMESFSEDTNRERHTIKAGEYVCLKIIDTGIGMDKAVRDRIFEPYFTTKIEKANIGFGMSVVFGVVKDHRGYIDIKSVTESNIVSNIEDSNTGTDVTIYFPVS